MASKVVNINKFRKSLNREGTDRQAMINRFKFGQTKAEKAYNENQEKLKDKELTGKKLNHDDPDVV